MLRSKQAEIEQHIDGLNARLANARADLLHLTVNMRLFDPSPTDEKPALSYHGSTRALKVRSCSTAARPLWQRHPSHGAHASWHKPSSWHKAGIYGDRDIRLTVAHRIGCMIGRYERRGLVESVGKKDATALWRLV